VVSAPQKGEWAVLVNLDDTQRTYTVENIFKCGEIDLRYPQIVVQALDEIGAYNEARRILERLGFERSKN
jgi:hypothetical protein